MERLKSAQLIEHIEEAKDWLDKAEQEYQQANPVRGELILNLAQAEVKHAWELSQQQFVTEDKSVREFKPRWLNPLPIAAAAILLVGLCGTVLLRGGGTTSDVSPRLADAHQNTVQHRVARVVSQPVTQSKNQPIVIARNPVVDKSESSHSTVETKKTVTPVVNRVDPVANPAVGDTIKPVSADNMQLTNANKENRDGTQSAVRTQPTTTLVIDEDALTKEASHSLRNGK